MQKVDWDKIPENEGGDFLRPVPGAYIARIVNAEDVEEKEYIRIEWDFNEGEYKGYNLDTFNRAGFWPTLLIRSYKPKALPFFKAFKTALEVSNRGYVFREDRISDMAGKLFGVILGEEEYQGNDGTVKTRLYVAQTRSIKAIQTGDFKVPELKRLAGSEPERKTQTAGAAPAETYQGFDDPNGDLPF